MAAAMRWRPISSPRKCGRLYLFDAAPRVQERLRQRFAGNDRIVVLSSAALEALPDQSLDLVIANSLIQYLSRGEFEALLDFWRRRLKASGKLVLADVISPESGALGDAMALLAFGFAGGFFWRACAGLVATFFSDYRKLRHDLGLTRYGAGRHAKAPRRPWLCRGAGRNQHRPQPATHDVHRRSPVSGAGRAGGG